MFKSVLAYSLICCAASLAADYHLSPDGNDANPGTAAAPYKTIARASRDLKPGDTCILHAGIVVPGGTAMGNYHIFTGNLAEVLLFTRALSDDEQEALSTYLSRKWKLESDQ